MTALQHFLDTWNDGLVADHVGPSLACGEVESLAALFEDSCHPGAAALWREAHAVDDIDPDDQHFHLNPDVEVDPSVRD